MTLFSELLDKVRLQDGWRLYSWREVKICPEKNECISKMKFIFASLFCFWVVKVLFLLSGEGSAFFEWWRFCSLLTVLFLSGEGSAPSGFGSPGLRNTKKVKFPFNWNVCVCVCVCLVLVCTCVAMGVVCGRLGAWMCVGFHGVGFGCGVPLGPKFA